MGRYEPGVAIIEAEIAQLQTDVTTLTGDVTTLTGIVDGTMSDPSGGLEVSTVINPANIATAFNVLYFTPIALAPCTITHLTSEISAAGNPTAVVRLGLYNVANATIPDALLVDAGTIDGTLLGLQSVALGVPLVWPGGLLFGAVCTQLAGSVGVMGSSISSGTPVAVASASGMAQDFIVQNAVAGAFPANAGPLTTAAAAPGLRIRGA